MSEILKQVRKRFFRFRAHEFGINFNIETRAVAYIPFGLERLGQFRIAKPTFKTVSFFFGRGRHNETVASHDDRIIQRIVHIKFDLRNRIRPRIRLRSRIIFVKESPATQTGRRARAFYVSSSTLRTLRIVTLKYRAVNGTDGETKRFYPPFTLLII